MKYMVLFERAERDGGRCVVGLGSRSYIFWFFRLY